MKNIFKNRDSDHFFVKFIKKTVAVPIFVLLFTTQAFAVTEVKTSIGTRAAENVDISGVAGTGPYTVTLAAAASNTVVGDVLTDEAAVPQTYLITVVNGTSLTVIAHTFGATGAPSAAAGSQATTTRAYSTLQAWETGENGDLVISDEQRTGVAYNDATFTAGVTIDGSTTDATRYMKLTVAEAGRHNGVASSGVKIDIGTTGNVITVNDNYTVIDGFEITGWGGTSAYAIGVSSANNVTIKNNVIHDDGGITDIGISVDATDATGANIIYNNVIYGISGDGIDVNNSGTTDTGIYNNTVYNSGAIGIDTAGGHIVKNNISVGNTGSAFNGTGNIQTNNISSDSTATGTDSKTSVTAVNLFINTTASSEDLHLKPGVPAVNAGTDLSATFTGDIDNKTRSNIFDIGADEYIANPLIVTSTSDPIVVQAGDGSSALDFQVTFTAASNGLDIVKKGTSSTGTWGNDLVPSGTLFTIGGESLTTTHTVVQNSPGEVIIEKTRTGVTSHYHIYPDGRIVLDAEGASSITVNQTATFTEYATGISHTTGYHAFVELIETAAGADTDYTSPDTPTIVAGSRVTNYYLDYYTDGFAEGEGSYVVQSAGNNAVVNFNGNTQTRYKPKVLLEEFYPSTKMTATTNFYSKLDAAADITSPTTGTGGTVTNGTSNIFGTSSSYKGVRGYAALINENSEYAAIPRVGHIGGTGTISFWYKKTGTISGYAYFFYGDTAATFGFTRSSGSNLSLIFQVSGSVSNTFTVGTNVFDGQWHHISIFWNDTTEQVGLFIDGTQESIATIAAFTVDVSYTNLRIGTNSAGDAPAMGLIDDFRVYNAVVKPTGHALFHSRMDAATDVTAPQVYQSSGTVTNGVTDNVFGIGSSYKGVRGYAGLFNEANEYVSIPRLGHIGGTGTMTFWYKRIASLNDWTGWGYLVGSDTAEVFGFGFTNTANSLIFRYGTIANVVTFTGVSNIVDGNWHHIAISWNDTTEEVGLYVDGKIESLTTVGGGFTMPTGYTNVRIGYGYPATDPANGLIDDFIIYDDAIFPYGAYNVPTAWGDTAGKADSSVLMYWAADSTTINVGSGSATLGGSMTVSTGINGNGLVNDNAGEYASAGSSGNIEANEGSIAFWVKSTLATNPVSSEYVFYGNTDFNSFFDTAGYINFEISSGVNLQYAADIYDAGWHSIRVTWDYTNDEYALYVDGVNRAASTTAYTAPTMDATMYFTAADASGTGRFAGSMDEIYISNSRSTPVISTANGVPIRQPQLAKPAAYKMDIGEDLSGVSSTYLQEPWTDYIVSNTNSASAYVVEYLGDITTTGAPIISGISATQTANTGNVVISYTGTDADGDTVTYTAADCEYSLDNTTWVDMTTAETTGAFTSGGAALSYTWATDTDTTTYDTTVYARLKGTDGENDSNQAATAAFTIDTLAPTGLGTFALGTGLGSTAPLSWTAVTDDSWANNAHYEIWYGTVQADVQNRTGTAAQWDNTNDSALATRTTTSTTITGLNTATTYYYKIWAVDGYNNEATVADISGTTATAIIANTGSGNWAAGATWDGGTVPQAGDTVTIPSGATITFNQADSGAGVGAVTIASGGTLNFDTSTTNVNRTMILNGDLTVNGTLTVRPPATSGRTTSIKFDNASSVQYGLIVTSTGTLDVQGTSASDRDVIITALTQDGTKNAYIYLQDGSQTLIKNAEISYMGDNVVNKYGIYAASVDGNVSAEGLAIEGGAIHNGYYGVYLSAGGYASFKNNEWYTFSADGIMLSGSGNNSLTGNIVRSSTGAGINIYNTTSDNNIVHGNVLTSNATGIQLNEGTDNNVITNNTIDTSSSRGIYILGTTSPTGNSIKNNIISNATTAGLTDGGTSTTISYNLFYNNTVDGSTGTNALLATNPIFVSTTAGNADFMYFTANSPALGAGVETVTGTVPGTINMGARLGYVKNITDNVKYNWMQDAHEALGLGAGDTVTTYAVDNKTDSIQSAVSALGSFFVTVPVSEATITANHDYAGHYAYMTDGTNKGEYYLITDSAEAVTDTITLYKSDQAAGLNAGDTFTIVDRVYARDGGAGQSANLYLTKDGTAGSEITWNVSGSVIIDAQDIQGYGIRMTSASYNIISGFMVQNATTRGINVTSFCTVTSNKLYSNHNGLYLSNNCKGNTVTSNEIFGNTGDGLFIYNSTGKNIFDSNKIYNNASKGIYAGGPDIVLISNDIYDNGSTGIYGFSVSNMVLLFNNIYSNSGTGLNSSGSNLTVFKNRIYSNGGTGIFPSTGAYTRVFYNNTVVGNSSDGMRLPTTASGATVRNNISAYNGGYGLYETDTGTDSVNSYNLFYGNTSGSSYQVVEGTGTVTLSAPGFHAFSSGTATGTQSSGTLQDTSKSWTVNQYAGYVVWIDGGTGAGQFRRIASNTADTLTLYTGTSFAVTPVAASSTYKIIDWSLDKNSAALGAGADAAGTANTAVNIGARFGYLYNTTDASKHNTFQLANDDSALGAGDSISAYAVTEVSAGTIGTTLTDNGPTITADVAEADITASHQYEGMYMYMTSGTNAGNYYLIIDSAEAATDTITLNTAATTGFAAADTYKIIDRIYNDKQTTDDADFTLSTSGSSGSYITWAPAAGNTVIIDAESKKAYDAYAANGVTALKFSDTFIYKNATTSSLGGEPYTAQTGGYYTWGGTGGTLASVSVSHASLVAGDTSNTTIAFTTANTVGINGDVQVTFPAGFDISGAAYVSGNTGATASVSGQVLTINLGTAVADSTAVSIVISGIKNPTVSGSTGTYALETQDSSDGTIDTAAAGANTITAGALTSASVTHASLVAGAASNTTIVFTTVNAVEVNGDVQVTFPAGFDISGAAYVSGNTGAAVSVSGQVLTVNLGTALTASSAVSIVVSGVKNPTVTGSPGTYAIETQNSSDVQIDTAAAAANTFTAGTLTSASVTHASLTAGATPETTISFTTANPVEVNGDVQVTFPSGFDLSGSLAVVSGNTGAGVSAGSQVLTVNLGTAVNASTGVSLVISGIKNPLVLGTTGTYAIETQNSSDVRIDTATATANTITVPTLTLLTPSAAGINLTVGDSYNITWSSSGQISNNLSLSYSTNGGTSYPNSIATGEANDGAYPWTVPAASAITKVKIQDVFYQQFTRTSDTQFNAGTYSSTELSGSGNNAGVQLTVKPTFTNWSQRLTGTYDTPWMAYGVFASGNYAYVADRSSGLQIIDVSTPSSPTLTGTYDTPGDAVGVFVSGNYAYVADGGSGLQVIDVSTPSSPVLAGTYDTTGYAQGVFISGNYAYVADYGSGLQVIDVSNPSVPTLAGTYNTTGNALRVYVSGNYAYVADDYSGLQIIDISTPSSPVLTGTYDTLGNAYDVSVSGNYAYVADNTYGLQIIDVSTPSSPVLTGTYNTPGNAYDVSVSGNYAYVADNTYGLQIIDVSTPSSPVLAGIYDTPSNARGVYVSGTQAYVADSYSGLQIIDASASSSPILAGNYNTSGSVRAVSVSGNYAYVAADTSGLKIIDVSTPSSPVLTGTYAVTVSDVSVSGNYAYIIAAGIGLYILDVSTPSSPVYAGNYLSSRATDVYVSGNYAYLAANTSGLEILDVSTPSSPVLTGSYNTPGNAYGVYVSGNYAYVADNYLGLQIIDVSTPSSPVFTGSYNTSGEAQGVSVSGNYAYVADGTSGLQIIDVSTPSSPVLAGSYNTPGYAYGVFVSGDYAYVADNTSGLYIIDVSTPSSPVFAGTYDTPGNALGLSGSGNYAYVADGSSGLELIQIKGYYSGTFESAGIDLGASAVDFSTVSWNAVLNGQTLTLKVRSDADGNFSNAAAWSSCSSITSGAALSTGGCVTNGHRYLQYQASLSSADTTVTPALDDISFSFTDSATSGIISDESDNNFIISAGALVSPTVTHASLWAGAASDTTIAFTTVNAIPVNGDVQVTFAAGFDLTGSLAVVSGNAGATVSSAGQVLTINLGTAVSAGGPVSIVVSGIVNPSSYGSGGTYAIETQNASGGQLDIGTASAHTFSNIVFSSPTSATSWSVGSANQLITWTESGTADSLAFDYSTDGSTWTAVMNDGADVFGNYTDGGDTVLWDIPGNATPSSTYRIRGRDTANANVVVGISDNFAVAGGLTLNAPAGGDKWSNDVPQQITWTTTGTFTGGVKVLYSTDSTNGTDGTWSAASMYASSADAASGTNILPNTDNNAITTGTGWWLPSRDLSAGTTNLWIKVAGADTSAPAVSAVTSGAVTVGKIDSVDITLPDRTATAVAVGADLNLNITSAGVSHVTIEYKSNAGAGSYVTCQTSAGVPATDIAVSSLPFSWRVPDDIYPSAGADIRVTASASSGLTGALSKTSSGFTIYGVLDHTAPVSGTYHVDNSSDRVPIVWTGSNSISAITFQYYSGSWPPPNEAAWSSAIGIGVGDIYNNATAGTASTYNWAGGSGTAWWQPKFTDGNIWMRVVDSNDTATVSSVVNTESFAVTGVAISGITATSSAGDTTYLTTLTTGDTRYIKGTGTTGSGTVNLYYIDSATQPSEAASWISIASGVSITSGAYTYTWTDVPDAISSTIWFKATDPGNESGVYNITSSAVAIQGGLTVTDPVSAWTVGETTNTLSGTVTGDIDTVDLQYSTDGSTWTDFATNLSIGNNSGTNAAAFTIASGSFTVPDAVSSASFRVRVKDSTTGRASGLLGDSASSAAFQVKGVLAVTSPTSAGSWYVGNTGTIGYTATGAALSDVIIEYAYRKSATGSDTPADYASGWTQILNTTNSAYMGSGTSAVARTYDWSAVADVVETLIGTGADEQDPGVYAASGNECWLMLRMRSTNADTVYSQGFRVKYYTITWQIKNLTGAYLTTLNVSEPAQSLKPAWTVSDYSLASSAGDFMRYYPYDSNSVSTTFTEQSGGIDYPETKVWTPNMDQTVAVTIDTSPSTSWAVKVDSSYDYSNNTLNITTWLEKKGLQLSSSQQSSLGAATVAIYNSSGAQINATTLSDSAPDGNGTYYISWDTDVDSVNLMRGQQYTMVSTVTYSSQTYTGIGSFTLESTSIFAVNIDPVYDSANDAFIVKSSLLQNGTLVSDNTNMSLSYFRVLNAGGTDLSGDLTGAGYTTTDTVNSIYQTTWDPAGGLTGNMLYTIKVTITYKGNTYTATKSTSVSDVGSLSTDVAALSTKVDAQTSTLQSDITSQTSTLQSSISSQTATITSAITSQTATIQSDISSQNTNIGAILEDTATTIPAKIVSELAKGVQSELLTRPGTVETGTTTKIRYRTATGLSPKITVYDEDNTKRVNAATMKEIGSTGIYEYDLTLDSSWGTGEYTVMAEEAAKGSLDSLILDVVEAGTTSSGSSTSSTFSTTSLDIVAAKVNKLDSNLNKVLANTEKVDETTGSVQSDIKKLLNKMGKMGGSSQREGLLRDPQKMEAYVGVIEAGLGKPEDMAGVGTILGKLDETQKAVGNLGPDGALAAERVQEAKEQVGAVTLSIKDIRMDIQEGNTEAAMSKLQDLTNSLSAVQDVVSEIPANVSTTSMTESMQNSLSRMAEMMEQRGFNNLVPEAERVQTGEAANPEDILKIRNSITELKALMTQVRTLMDKEVNKPVISGWLEGNLE